MSRLQRKSRSSTSYGKTWFRFRRRFVTWRWFDKDKSSRSSKTIHSKVHSVSRACLPVSRCKLSSTFLSENETCGATHEKLQEKNTWWLSNLQATDCLMLLSRETLSRGEMLSALLSKYQTETKTATVTTKVRVFNADYRILFAHFFYEYT